MAFTLIFTRPKTIAITATTVRNHEVCKALPTDPGGRGHPQRLGRIGDPVQGSQKCINRVVEELREVGLERETLQALLEYQAESSTENGTELAASSPAIPSRIANADKSRRLSSPSLISYKFDGDTKTFPQDCCCRRDIFQHASGRLLVIAYYPKSSGHGQKTTRK